MRRPPSRNDPLVKELGEDWHRRVTAGGCQICPELGEECEGMIQGHHVLYQQHIERYISAVAHEEYLDEDEERELRRRLIWDPRNGIGVCYRAHRRHHNRIQPIPLRLIPFAAIKFASEIGLGYRIEETYPA